MSEITFTVSYCENSRELVAVWNSPGGGGIRVLGTGMDELCDSIFEAIASHFEEDKRPTRVRLAFSGEMVPAALQAVMQHRRGNLGMDRG